MVPCRRRRGVGRSVMPGRAGRWDGSLTRRPARRPSGVAVWGVCKSLNRKRSVAEDEGMNSRKERKAQL